MFSRAKNEISQLAVETRKTVSEPKLDGRKRLKTYDYPRDFCFRKNQLPFEGWARRDLGVGGVGYTLHPW
jgi:hypothetical protein